MTQHKRFTKKFEIEAVRLEPGGERGHAND